MTKTRREAIGFAGMLGGVGAVGAASLTGARPAEASVALNATVSAASFGVESGRADVTRALQSAIEQAAGAGTPLLLPPGEYRVTRLNLPNGAQIAGAPGASRLVVTRANGGLSVNGARGVRLSGLVIEGDAEDVPASPDDALVSARGARDLVIRDCDVRNAPASGVYLQDCSARIQDNRFSLIGETALISIDGVGVEIIANTITDCENNGVRVWRSEKGEDRTLVSHNRIMRINNVRGGDGPWGNAINVFKAGGVQVSNNLMSDCRFSGFRANSADNLQVVNNSILRAREVAIYVEFGFEGAVVMGNLVDDAAAGMEVTNFNNGGRLAVVQGNLIRNIRKRDDIVTRPHGIFVEADAAVTGNVIENALTIGIQIGRGAFQRDVTAMNNLIRDCGIGIGASDSRDAGTAVIRGNLIVNAPGGAVRAFSDRTPVGPDLTVEGAQAYPHLVVADNTAR